MILPSALFAIYHTRRCFANFFQFSPERVVVWYVALLLDPSIRPVEDSHISAVQESDDDVFEQKDFELNDSSPGGEPVCNTPKSTSSARSGFTTDGTACYTDDDDA